MTLSYTCNTHATQVPYGDRSLTLCRRKGVEEVVVSSHVDLLSGFSLTCLNCDQTFCKRNNQMT